MRSFHDRPWSFPAKSASGRAAGAVATARVEPLEDRRLLSVSLTTLAAFNGANGECPMSGLTADAAGNLYGTTFGNNGHATVYEIAAGSNKLVTLTTFTGANSDISPVISDAAGNLYGTTTYGGNVATDPLGSGTAFKIAAGTHKVTTIATFNFADGDSPVGALTMDAAGNFYGVTSNGGAYNDGTVYKIAAGSNAIATLASFSNASGIGCTSALYADGAGNLFGTTLFGGRYGDGTVFKVAAGSSKITVLASFSGQNGAGAKSSLVADAAGNLYGETEQGGDLAYNTGLGDGVVFKLAVGTNKLTAIADFDAVNGNGSPSGLLFDAAGNLYGSTLTGGNLNLNAGYGYGTIFKIAAGSSSVTTLASLTVASGDDPCGPLVADGAGNLYAAMGGGGNLSLNSGQGFGAISKLTGSGYVPYSITGEVFNDANGDGILNSGEKGLAHFEIYIDSNDNGKLDAGELSVQTNSSGDFSFTGLTAGTYIVRIVPIKGWAATKPTGGVLTIKFGAGKSSTGNLFGEQAIAQSSDATRSSPLQTNATKQALASLLRGDRFPL